MKGNRIVTVFQKAFAFLLAFLCIFCFSGEKILLAAPLKIATWNIENLRSGTNTGVNPRDGNDLSRLSTYVSLLDADIIALQEVENAAAAAQIFNPNNYNFYFSDRNLPPRERLRQRTGFAVVKGLTVSQNSDFTDLNVSGGLRHGTDITVSVDGQDLRLLSVHLKSGCFGDSLSSSSRDACEKLKKQLPELEKWIDDRAEAKVPFVVLGDFNRRLNLPEEEFWLEIDDSSPANADLTKVTEGKISNCWNSQFPEYIDHIVLDKESNSWLDKDSFSQVVYTESQSLEDKISDHCPISIVLNTPQS